MPRPYFLLLILEDILESISNLIQETDLELKNIDIQQMAKYLYIMYDREKLVKEEVVSCIPGGNCENEGVNKLLLVIMP